MIRTMAVEGPDALGDPGAATMQMGDAALVAFQLIGDAVEYEFAAGNPVRVPAGGLPEIGGRRIEGELRKPERQRRLMPFQLQFLKRRAPGHDPRGQPAAFQRHPVDRLAIRRLAKFLDRHGMSPVKWTGVLWVQEMTRKSGQCKASIG